MEENEGYIATHERVYVNESYQYRYDRLHSSQGISLDEFVISNIEEKFYDPFQKSWFITANSSYPNGTWSGPQWPTNAYNLFVRSDGRVPVFVYTKKIPFGCCMTQNATFRGGGECRDSTNYANVKLTVGTSQFHEIIERFADEDDDGHNNWGNSVDVILLNEEFTVVACRNLSRMMKYDGETFRKLWEMEGEEEFGWIAEHFGGETGIRETFREVVAGTVDVLHLSNAVHVFALPHRPGWTVLFHMRENVFFHDLTVLARACLAVASVVIGILGVAVVYTIVAMSITICHKRRDETLLRNVENFSEALATVRFDDPKLRDFLAKEDSKCTALELHLKLIAQTIKSYGDFLPDGLKVALFSEGGDTGTGTGGGRHHLGKFRSISSDSSSSEYESFLSVDSVSVVASSASPSPSTASANSRRETPAPLPTISRRRPSLSMVAIPGLSSLNARVGTILYLTVRGFSLSSNTSVCANFLRTYFRTITTSVEMHNGVLAPITSQAVLISWNFFHRSVDHRCSAVECACRIFADLAKGGNLNDPWVLSGSIVSARALAGVVGCEGSSQGFGLVGSAVEKAKKLERLNFKYGTDLLMDSFVHRACHFRTKSRCVDIVSFDTGDELGIPIHENDYYGKQLMYEILGWKSISDSSREWMYELKELEEQGDHFQDLNQAWEYFMKAD